MDRATRKQRTLKMVQLAILLALVIVLQLFGSSIKVGATSFSLVLIPIALGGMLLGYLRENDMGKAFRYGVAGGAASVMTEGTQLIVPEDFYNLLDQVRIQEV